LRIALNTAFVSPGLEQQATQYPLLTDLKPGADHAACAEFV